MNNGILNLDSYFERIGYTACTAVSEESLQGLHMAHTLNIPFENLDVYYRRPILLDEGSLFKKLVDKRRGGYCFEMNGLFSLVLHKLGFKVTNLLARGIINGADYTAKTHQVLIAEINSKKWLADVGFGNDGITAPLLLKENVDQTQFAHTYRIIKNPVFGYILQKKTEDGYVGLYAFNLDECYPMDFIVSNHFTSTHPESFFLTMKMCTMPTNEGRITLTDTYFKTVTNGNVIENPVENDDEFNRILNKYFNLDLNMITV